MDRTQIKPLDFRDFDSGVAIIRNTGAKTFLPGGRRRSEAPPPPPPIFNETQLKAAEAESYKKGFLDGTEEGKKQQDNDQAMNDRKLLEGLEQLLQDNAKLFADYRHTILRAQQDLPKAALMIARKVADGALADNAAAAVETTAMRCVEMMLGEPKLQITVHESLAEALKKKVETIAVRMPDAKDIVVTGKSDIQATDCRIEWKDGALVRDTQAIWDDITRTIEGMSASAKHQAEAHLENLPDAPSPAETEQKEIIQEEQTKKQSPLPQAGEGILGKE